MIRRRALVAAAAGLILLGCQDASTSDPPETTTTTSTTVPVPSTHAVRTPLERCQDELPDLVAEYPLPPEWAVACYPADVPGHPYPGRQGWADLPARSIYLTPTSNPEPGLSSTKEVYLHEAGHAWCWVEAQDASEECAWDWSIPLILAPSRGR